MVDPELPQSSGTADAWNCPPVPVISMTPFSRLETFAPSASAHARLLAQSAPVEKLVSFVVPEANALSNA
jgi:hypothetical protein